MLTSVLTLLIAMSSIQFGASLAHGLFPVVGGAGASLLRLIFASSILVLIFRPWRKKYSSIEIKQLAFYGVALGLMNLTFFLALERIPLGITVALEFTGPLAVAIFTSHKKIDLLWALLAIIGIVLLTPAVEASGPLDPIGIVFALAAGLFWGLYIIFGQKAGKTLHGGVATSMGMLFATLTIIPFGLFLDGPRLLNTSALPLGLLVGILSSALPYTLEMFSLKRMPANTFGVFMSLEPAIASLFGLILLGETLNQIQWSAIICVMASSIGSTFTSSRT